MKANVTKIPRNASNISSHKRWIYQTTRDGFIKRQASYTHIDSSPHSRSSRRLLSERQGLSPSISLGVPPPTRASTLSDDLHHRRRCDTRKPTLRDASTLPATRRSAVPCYFESHPVCAQQRNILHKSATLHCLAKSSLSLRVSPPNSSYHTYLDTDISRDSSPPPTLFPNHTARPHRPSHESPESSPRTSRSNLARHLHPEEVGEGRGGGL